MRYVTTDGGDLTSGFCTYYKRIGEEFREDCR